MEKLTPREEKLLAAVVKAYSKSANPVPSSYLAEVVDIEIGPASIRRALAELEEKGFLYHPHTSAGRVPTSLGYRYFVNHLLSPRPVSKRDRDLINSVLNDFTGDVEYIMERVAGALAELSNQMGIIIAPKFLQNRFEHMEMLPVSANRMMVVLSILGGQVKTILIEMRNRISREDIKRITQKINQRFHGHPLQQIREQFPYFIHHLRQEKAVLVRLLETMADQIFNQTRDAGYLVEGTLNLMHQPEFSEVRQISALIEIIENKDYIIHFMENRETNEGLNITVGHEHTAGPMQRCSVVTSGYKIGEAPGILGIIGTERMAYEYIIPLIDFTAHTMNKKLATSG
jgi:heat-inducible transcriptional repressor